MFNNKYAFVLVLLVILFAGSFSAFAQDSESGAVLMEVQLPAGAQYLAILEEPKADAAEVPDTFEVLVTGRYVMTDLSTIVDDSGVERIQITAIAWYGEDGQVQVKDVSGWVRFDALKATDVALPQEAEPLAERPQADPTQEVLPPAETEEALEPEAAEASIANIGEVWKVIGSALNVRIAPSADSPQAVASQIAVGVTFVVRELASDVEGNLWVQHDMGWSALQYNGSMLAEIVEGAPADTQTLTEGSGGGFIPVSVPPQVLGDNPDGVVGQTMLIPPSDFPAEAPLPEGGATYVYCTNGVIGGRSVSSPVGEMVVNLVVFHGATPAEGDLNSKFAIESCEGGAGLMIINAPAPGQSLQSYQARLIDFLFEAGYTKVQFLDTMTSVSQTIDAASIGAGGGGPVAAPIEMDTTFASGVNLLPDASAMFMPYGATQIKNNETGELRGYFYIPQRSEVDVPVGSDGFLIVSCGECKVDGDLVQTTTDGTINNVILVLGNTQTGDPRAGMISIDGLSPYIGVTSIYGEDEDATLGAKGAVENSFRAPNCGDFGCPGPNNLYVVYWDTEVNDWVSEGPFPYSSIDSVTVPSLVWPVSSEQPIQ
jgi:hypothetical protein